MTAENGNKLSANKTNILEFKQLKLRSTPH